MRDEIRGPVVEWEEHEAHRLSVINDMIFNLRREDISAENTSDEIGEAMAGLRALVIGAGFQELAPVAEEAKAEALQRLDGDLARAMAREDLERREAEMAKREAELAAEKARQEEEARIEAEAKAAAEAKAKAEAEAREAEAAAERARLAQEAQDAIARAEAAENAAKAAQEAAARAKEEDEARHQAEIAAARQEAIEAARAEAAKGVDETDITAEPEAAQEEDFAAEVDEVVNGVPHAITTGDKLATLSLITGAFEQIAATWVAEGQAAPSAVDQHRATLAAIVADYEGAAK